MKPILALVATVCLLLFSSPVWAGSLILQLTDSDGNPVSDAVVKLTGDTPGAVLSHQSHIIDQRDETFSVYVLLISVGDDVTFRNSDQTRHHVYSFSPLGQFEYLLAPGEKSPPILLSKPGVVAVGCNIHDRMITHIYVSDTAWAARSDPQGQVEIKDVPNGTYVAHIWHPKLRPGKPELAETVTLGDSPVKLSSVLQLLPDRPKSGGEYRRY
ncbi:MAG TPA: methylamine utilization protein [Rhodospirillaceae bacterium]|nr:methylamine utilization protein [Rhodospirillaceae bacterium]